MTRSTLKFPGAAMFLAAAAASIFLAYLMPGNAQPPRTRVSGDKDGPAGELVTDASTGLPGAMPLTMNFVRSPDADGPDGLGRYLIAVNSGYGLTFNYKDKAQQTLSVIDLAKTPKPQVVQTLYFPSPQSANVGVGFDRRQRPNGKFRMYVSGGFENKIWIFALDPKAAVPFAPANKPGEPVTAPFIDVTAFADFAPSPQYNYEVAPVYPTGIAVSRDGETIYAANNLADSLGIISDLKNSRAISRIPLGKLAYPYDVKLTENAATEKVYVSLWGLGTVAVYNVKSKALSTRIRSAAIRR